MSTIVLPKLLANFQTSLSATMSNVAITLTLSRSTDNDGTTLSGIYELTIDEGTSKEEHMYVTLAGSAGTVSRRGLSKVDAWTEVTANKFQHERGASVKITNFSLVAITRLLSGDDTFNAVNWLGVNSITGLATPTSGETTKAANIAYVNAVAIAGASDASSTTKGIVEKATTAETQTGTDAGGTTAPLFAAPSDIAKNTQNQQHVYATDTGSANAYVITLAPVPAAYALGQRFSFKAVNANTTASTLNVNSLGVIAIKKFHDQALENGDIEAGQIVDVVYNGTVFEMQTPLASQLTTAISTEVTSFFGATDISGAEAETLSSAATSVADTLHTHDFAAQAEANMRAGYVAIHGNASDGLATALTASAVITREYAITHFACLANGDDAFLQKVLSSDGGTAGVVAEALNINWADGLDFTFRMSMATTTNQDVFMGFDEALLAAVPASATSVVKHIGWFINNNSLYASVASGTTQTKTSAITATLTNWNTYRIVWTPATSAVFYLNGAIVSGGTITTNLPTGTTSASRVNIDMGLTSTDGGGVDKLMNLANNYVVKAQIA